jgi:predicted TIM-barrel fold metal-dependent hydrolase
MQANDLILVSVDDHICEPPTMFDAHVPEAFRQYTPQIVDEPNGAQRWWYGDVPGRNLGLNACAGKPREFYNVDAERFDEMRQGCYDVHERVRDMSAGGQLAGLNFPNWTGFAGQVLNQGPDRRVNEVMIKAYNDWHVDEWCGAYPDRFIPCGILPLFDAELAAKEVRRLADKGCHAVTFSENPQALNMPSVHSGEWDPLFKAASDVGTILCLHVGSSSRSPRTTSDAPASVRMTLTAVASIHTLSELVWADFWGRFPNLRVSLTEGDIGWIPYFLWRAEHVQDRHSGWTGAEFPGGMSGPKAVFDKHFISCFISDRIGPKLLDEFNLDNVCWESDYPHSDSIWPFGPEDVIENLAGQPDDVINKITYENAMRLYQFDPFAHRPKEQCTVGALRSEALDVDVVTHVGRPADERDLRAWNTYMAGKASADPD